MLRRLVFFLLNVLLLLRHCRQAQHFSRFVGYFPNIARPRRYHEKMLWRKIFDHNPLFVTFCGKLATKEYVRARVPELRVPETLWTGKDLRLAPRDLLASGAVLKANHASNCNLFTGAPGFDPDRAEAQARDWLRTTYGLYHYEWGYFDVPKLLFLEELIPTDGPASLLDLKIRCADGQAVSVSVFLEHMTPGQKFGAFRPDGSPLVLDHDSYGGRYAPLPPDFRLPPELPQAVAFAERLSRGVDFCRFDFLHNGRELFAGEITVYPTAGMTRAAPEGRAGIDDWSNPHWDLRRSWFLRAPQPGWRGLYARQLGRALDQDAAAGRGNDA